MSLYLGNNLISGVATPVEPTRNIGQIIQSTLPLVDVGLHLLDGSLILGGGIYQGFVDYIDNLYNDTKVYNPSAFTVVGSPTITDDGIASGFGNGNGLTFQRNLNGLSDFTFAIKSTNISSQLQPIIYLSVYNRIAIATDGTIIIFADENNATGNSLTLLSQNPLQINTNYLIKIKYNGVQTYSVECTNLDTNTKVTDSGTLSHSFPNSLQTYSIGLDRGSNRYISGSIDLKQFSITVDGVEVFSGSKPANYFCTEAQWQTSVADYGVCGKFVYDSVNNTVRLPKITGIVEGASGVANLGDLTEAGLPNITGFHGLSGYGQVGGAFYAVTDLSESISSGASSSNGVRFDASRSSSIYGNSNTVQSQTIKALYYIVIATTTKTEIEVDIDEVATDLNGKADVDLSNVANTAGFRKLVDVYNNGTSWYKVFREYNPQNGSYVGLWCEQGGRFNANNTATTASYTVNLLKSYKDTNYSIVTCGYSNHADQFKNGVAPYSFTTSSFVIQTFNNDALQPIVWQASGYIEV